MIDTQLTIEDCESNTLYELSYTVFEKAEDVF